MGWDYGFSAVVCGPGSIAQVHKADEFVSVQQILVCLDMLEGLGRELVRLQVMLLIGQLDDRGMVSRSRPSTRLP